MPAAPRAADCDQGHAKTDVDEGPRLDYDRVRVEISMNPAMHKATTAKPTVESAKSLPRRDGMADIVSEQHGPRHRVMGRGGLFAPVMPVSTMVAMNRRGKSVAISTAVVSVVVLAAAGFVAKDRMFEEWNVYQLSRGETDARRDAALRLTVSRSARALPVFEQALRDPDLDVRCYVARAICVVGQDTDRAIPYLVKLLDHEDRRFHLEASLALGCHGPRAMLAVPKLKDIVLSDKWATWAAEALERIQGR